MSIGAVVYGPCSIDVQQTHDMLIEDVYDDTGLDYLWTRWTIDVTGVVNLGGAMGGAMSYQTVAGNPNPVRNPGVPAFLTHQAVRDALSQPRQPLVVTDTAGNVLLRSPGFAPVPAAGMAPGGGAAGQIINNTYLDCDCDGGPKPLRPVEILSIHGDGKSVIVRFSISTTVNESVFWVTQGGQEVPDPGQPSSGLGRAPGDPPGGLARPKPPIIGSNRWSATEELDEAAFSTRIYEGRVVFRADLLRDFFTKPPGAPFARVAVPDDFRSWFARFFCPLGFQRAQVYAQAEPSGFAVRYRVTDVQMPTTLLDRRACKLDIVRVTGVGRKSTSEAGAALASEGAGSWLGTVGSAIMTSAESWRLGINVAGHQLIHGNVGGAFQAVWRGGKAALGVADSGIADSPLGRAIMPTGTDRFIITATGNPTSNRWDLTGICYAALAGILQDFNSTLTGQEVYLTQDYRGKWVRLEVLLTRGPSQVFAQFKSKDSSIPLFGNVIDLRGIPGRFPAGVPGDPAAPRATVLSDSIPVGQNSTQSGTLVSGDASANPPYPNDQNTRGAQPVLQPDGSIDGTAVEWLVAQALMYPYTEAPQPQGHDLAVHGAVPP
jgi:hypothetical protein